MSNSATDVGAPGAGTVSNDQPQGWRAAWAHWMKMGHAVGVVQTRVLMVVFYFIVVMPLGLALRLRGDPLHLRPRQASNWTPHEQQERSVDSSRRQF